MEPETPEPKRRRFSLEPDLEVEVEGEVIRLRSSVLMAASEVFGAMLESQMREGQSGRISLEGKKKAEFELLLQHLDLRGGAALPEIECDTVDVLLRWADEYQINGLKARCEGFLVSYPCRATEMLKLALEYGLPKLKQRAANVMGANIYKHRQDILPYVNDHEFLMMLMPALRRNFGLTAEAPGEKGAAVSSVEALWEVVVKAMDEQKCADSYYDKRTQCLRKTIADLIPLVSLLGIHRGDYVRMVTTAEVVRSSTRVVQGYTFDAQEVQAMVEFLLAKGELHKTVQSGKLYRTRVL